MSVPRDVTLLLSLAPALAIPLVLVLGVGLWTSVSLEPLRESAAMVEVIVPAHNEEERLELLLASLGVQQGVALRVTVVDDRSEDGTAAVAERFGARVWSVTERRGNNPKAAALASYAPCEEADVLLFVDADVVFDSPRAVAMVSDEVRAHPDDLLSVQPYHRMERASERLAFWPNLVAVLASGAFLPARAHRSRATFGPVLACTPSRYRDVGGHAAVMDSVLDDEALGRRVRAAGGVVRLFVGRGWVSFRMYPRGVRALFEGFRKNVAIGALWVRGAAAIGATLVVVASLAALANVVVRPQVPANVAVLVGVAIANWVVARRLGNYGLGSLVGQIGGLVFFVVVVACSVVDLARGTTRWKGQRMRTR